MKDKVSLTYKNRQLKVMLGKKELPLDKMIDPATITLSNDDLPTLTFELILDTMEIDNIKALGEYVKFKDEEYIKPPRQTPNPTPTRA